MRGGEEGIENTFPAFTLSFLLPTCHLAVTLCLITTRGITVLGLIVSSASMYDKHVLLTVTRDFFFPPLPTSSSVKITITYVHGTTLLECTPVFTGLFTE